MSSLLEQAAQLSGGAAIFGVTLILIGSVYDTNPIPYTGVASLILGGLIFQLRGK